MISFSSCMKSLRARSVRSSSGKGSFRCPVLQLCCAQSISVSNVWYWSQASSFHGCSSRRKAEDIAELVGAGYLGLAVGGTLVAIQTNSATGLL